MNKWIGIGNIVDEPTLSFTQGKGTVVCKFRLACRRDKENSDFLSCVAWNKTAELIANSFIKGSKIAITGSIKTGSYEKDGVKRYTTEIWIETFEFVEKKQQSQTNNAVVNSFDDLEPVDGSDIPFN